MKYLSWTSFPVLFLGVWVKMKVARCFGWVLSVPLTFAAAVLLGQKRPSAQPSRLPSLF